jgi:hypothetical protein
VLHGVRIDRVRQPRIPDHGIGAEAERAGRRNEAIAPVPEAVAIAVDEDGRPGDQVVRPFEIGNTREMHVEHDDHRRRLRQFKAELTPDFDTHGHFPLLGWMRVN